MQSHADALHELTEGMMSGREAERTRVRELHARMAQDYEAKVTGMQQSCNELLASYRSQMAAEAEAARVQVSGALEEAAQVTEAARFEARAAAAAAATVAARAEAEAAQQLREGESRAAMEASAVTEVMAAAAARAATAEAAVVTSAAAEVHEQELAAALAEAKRDHAAEIVDLEYAAAERLKAAEQRTALIVEAHAVETERLRTELTAGQAAADGAARAAIGGISEGLGPVSEAEVRSSAAWRLLEAQQHVASAEAAERVAVAEATAQRSAAMLEEARFDEARRAAEAAEAARLASESADVTVQSARDAVAAGQAALADRVRELDELRASLAGSVAMSASLEKEVARLVTIEAELKIRLEASEEGASDAAARAAAAHRDELEALRAALAEARAAADELVARQHELEARLAFAEEERAAAEALAAAAASDADARTRQLSQGMEASHLAHVSRTVQQRVEHDAEREELEGKAHEETRRWSALTSRAWGALGEQHDKFANAERLRRCFYALQTHALHARMNRLSIEAEARRTAAPALRQVGETMVQLATDLVTAPVTPTAEVGVETVGVSTAEAAMATDSVPTATLGVGPSEVATASSGVQTTPSSVTDAPLVRDHSAEVASLSGAPLADLVDAAIATADGSTPLATAIAAAGASAAGAPPSAESASAHPPVNTLIDRAMLLAESTDNSSLRSELGAIKASLATAHDRERELRDKLDELHEARAVDAARHSELLQAQVRHNASNHLPQSPRDRTSSSTPFSNLFAGARLPAPRSVAAQAARPGRRRRRGLAGRGGGTRRLSRA